ncbi:hypothetical protein ACFQRC_07400 [Enterovirga sp. GCM10030262]|uniref:hypothetical protein n=1 Tax=Enterovirga sp. GCM10030262 TaxID=3273391 RepID=UPI003618E218
MMLFFFSNDRGFDRNVFAIGQHRASELFLAHQVLNNVPVCRYWCERVTVGGIVEPHRTHLRQALELGMEGVGTYDESTGWRIDMPHEESARSV